MSSVLLKTNERVFLTGKTGSGKTFLAHYLTKSCPRLVVLDGKGTLAPWGLEPWEAEGRDKLRRGDPVRLRVVVPFRQDPAKYWDSAMYEIYMAGNVTVYMDELYVVSPPGKQIPPLLWSLYTRGRELGIGVWGASQRPAWIPQFCMSEAEHFFMFRLQLSDDKKRMSEFMGPDILEPIQDEHGFYYSKAEWDRPEYYQKLETGKHEQIDIERTSIPTEKIEAARSSMGGPASRKKHFDLSKLWSNLQ